MRAARRTTTALVRPVICCLIVLDSFLSVLNTIQTLSDRDELQKAFHMLTSCSERRMLKLNLTKCSILSVKRKDPILYDYYIKENTRDAVGKMWESQ